MFQMGCDASDGLLELCNSRGLDVFTANCLNLPFRDNCADGAISIAVIHHLVNQVNVFKNTPQYSLIRKYLKLISGTTYSGSQRDGAHITSKRSGADIRLGKGSKSRQSEVELLETEHEEK